MTSSASLTSEQLVPLFQSGELFTSGMVKIDDLSRSFFVCAAASYSNNALDNVFRVKTGDIAIKAHSSRIDFQRIDESTYAFARFDDEVAAEKFSEKLSGDPELLVSRPFLLPEHTI